jgi:hypothetical protein
MNGEHEMAEHRRFLKRMADASERMPVKAIMEEAELVYGVWADAGEPDGVDWLILKGERLLRESMASGGPISTQTAAIWCESREDARSVRQTFGSHELDS